MCSRYLLPSSHSIGLARRLGTRKDVVWDHPVFCRWSGVVLSVRFSFNVTEEEMAGSSCSYWTLNETHLCLVFFLFCLFCLLYPFFLSVLSFVSLLFLSLSFSLSLWARGCVLDQICLHLFFSVFVSHPSPSLSLWYERRPGHSRAEKQWNIGVWRQQPISV